MDPGTSSLNIRRPLRAHCRLIMPTDYIAPFALWIVVRCHSHHGGSLFVEPACIGSGEDCCVAIFVSRLDAYIDATLRNARLEGDDPNRWHCLPLRAFDLRAYAREQGGSVDCAMAFGFACDSEGALVVSCGAPCPCYVELSFDLPEHGADVTFDFSQWAFGAIHEQWEEIGAHAHGQTIARTEAMPDDAFAWLLDIALSAANVTSGQSQIDRWTVFDAVSMRWICASASSDAMLQTMPTLH